MSQTHPHPDLWYPIAALLSALRALLRTTAPEAFAAISAEARAQLAALTALVRRYLHVLAADILLPPRRPPAQTPAPERTGPRTCHIDPLFPLAEQGDWPRRVHGPGGEDPPELQWALLWQAVSQLVSVMADPAPHARRLARFLRSRTDDALRELPVRWHVIRRLGPYADTLLNRLDQLARPRAWEGLDTS